MNSRKSTVASLTLVALIVAVLGPISAPAAAAVAVGQTATAGATVDGIQVPSGTTLLSPALVEAAGAPTVIHLTNGQVLALTEDARAMIESTDAGAIQVSVESGKLAYSDDGGEVTTVASNNLVVLDQEGQVGEGARIGSASPGQEDEERLCQLQDSTPARFARCNDKDAQDDEDCDWELLEVPMSEVPQYLNIDSLLACEDRNPLDLNCNCQIEAAGYLWWKVAGGVLTAAVGYKIIDGSDDDEKPASPTTP